ncbi:MAG: hypothetical protein JO243_16030 [Solirubrobacterales bacterium]|nr:hypothetical protein [Solirubrobacterales bacterium]
MSMRSPAVPFVVPVTRRVVGGLSSEIRYEEFAGVPGSLEVHELIVDAVTVA